MNAFKVLKAYSLYTNSDIFISLITIKQQNIYWSNKKKTASAFHSKSTDLLSIQIKGLVQRYKFPIMKIDDVRSDIKVAKWNKLKPHTNLSPPPLQRARARQSREESGRSSAHRGMKPPRFLQFSSSGFMTRIMAVNECGKERRPSGVGQKPRHLQHPLTSPNVMKRLVSDLKIRMDYGNRY